MPVYYDYIVVVAKINLGDIVEVEYVARDGFLGKRGTHLAIGFWDGETGDNLFLYNPAGVELQTHQSGHCIWNRGSGNEQNLSNRFNVAKGQIKAVRRLYLDRLLTWKELTEGNSGTNKEILGRPVEVLSGRSRSAYEECRAGFLRGIAISPHITGVGPSIDFGVHVWDSHVGIRRKLQKLILTDCSFNPVHINLLTTQDLSDEVFFPEDMYNLHEEIPCPFDLGRLTNSQKEEFVQDYKKLIRRVGIEGMKVIYEFYLLEKKGADYKRSGISFFLNTANIQLRWAEKGAPLCYSPLPHEPCFKQSDLSFDGTIPIPPEKLPAFFKAIDERKYPLRQLPLSYVKPLKTDAPRGPAMLGYG